MKDRIKLNNALDGIDERFIEEAANFGAKKRSAPKWLKYTAIPVGCAAAAAVVAVCIVAAGNSSRGVDLVEPSSQTDFSAADIVPGKDSEQHFAYYDFGAATLEMNVDDNTFTLYPCDEINSTPMGTFTVGGDYISLYFTQLDDVKYRGRLNADYSEITILNPDDRLYGWLCISDTLRFDTSESDETVDVQAEIHPTVVFKWSDGAKLSANVTAESADISETAESSVKKEVIRDEPSAEEENEVIKQIIIENSAVESFEDDISSLKQQIEELKAKEDELRSNISEQDDGSDIADLTELADSYAERIAAKELDLEELESMSLQKGIDRKDLIAAAMQRRDVPLSMDGMIVTSYSGYDSWTGRIHNGVDLTSPDMNENTVVTAFMDGRVIKVADSGWNYGLGKYIIIDHGNGISTVYAHLSSVDVPEGQAVNAGDVIGRTGTTGWSTGIHLHFEIRENGEISELMNSYPGVDSRFGWVVGGDGGLISEMMDGHGGYYGHKGIDIQADIGTPVLAADDGTVVLAEWYYGYGNCVMIDHGDLVTLYGHLDEISVSAGQQVEMGDIVGTVGQTGQTAAPALHFEVRQDASEDSERLDPIDYLPWHARADSCAEE